MDVLKRIDTIRALIHSKEKIKNQFVKEGNELGVKRIAKDIDKLRKELNNLI